MPPATVNRERKRFRSMGEAATRAYLAGALPNLRSFQRTVAAAEHVLKKFERAKQRKPEPSNGHD